MTQIVAVMTTHKPRSRAAWRAPTSLLVLVSCSIASACGSADQERFWQHGAPAAGNAGARAAVGGTTQGGADVAGGSGGASPVSGALGGSAQPPEGDDSAGEVQHPASSAGSSAAGARGGSLGAPGGAGAAGRTGTVQPAVHSGSLPLTRFRGPYCAPIQFASALEGELGVQLSALMPGSRAVHDGLTTWVESVTRRGFVACASEDAGFDNAHPDFSLQWLAYTHQSFAPGVLADRAELAATEGRQCQSVAFARTFATRPQVQARLSVPVDAAPGTRVSGVWLEEVDARGFRFCVEPLANADASLAGSHVEWLAYPSDFDTLGFSAGEWNFGAFAVTACATVQTGCANCDNAQLTINHHRRTESAEHSHDAALLWGEDFSATGALTFCVHKGSLYTSGDADAAHVSVSYLLRRESD